MFPIYLDNHATTHLDPNVLKGMLPFLKITGNASNKLHYYGKCASHAVETARCKVAALIQANPSEIIFTSGATESNNISILGSAKSNEHFGNHIITTQIEHLSILKSVLELKKQGFSVSFVKPDKYGCISVKSIYNEITKQTILISVMFANNEIGTINPISEIANLASRYNILFHTDAVQAIGLTDVSVKNNNIDLLSISGHKIYGPKGIGALFVKESIKHKLTSIMFGGNHEYNLRPGTLNVAGIVGLGIACDLVKSTSKVYMPKIKLLRDLLETTLTEELTNIHINGSIKFRLVSNLNVSFKFIDINELTLFLAKKIAFSSSSACCSDYTEPSHVIKAINNVYDDFIYSSFRFGIGKFNTKKEIILAAKIIISSVKKLLNRSVYINKYKYLNIL